MYDAFRTGHKPSRQRDALECSRVIRQDGCHSPSQSLLVVDEAEVGGLTDQTGRLTGLDAGLALLGRQKPQGADGRPNGGGGDVGGPAKGCGVGEGDKQRPRTHAARQRFGEVAQREWRLWNTEVLEGSGYRDTVSQPLSCASLHKTLMN